MAALDPSKLTDLFVSHNPITTVRQSRLPIFPISVVSEIKTVAKKNGAKLEKRIPVDWDWANQWGSVAIKKCELTQKDGDILEAIQTCATDFFVSDDGMVSVCFDRAEVLKMLGARGHSQWLDERFEKMRTAQLVVRMETGDEVGQVHSGILSQYAKSTKKASRTPSKCTYLKNFKKNKAVDESKEFDQALYVIQYSASWSRIYFKDTWCVRKNRDVTQTIINMKSYAAKALARFMLSHAEDQHHNLKRLMFSIRILREGTSDRNNRKILQGVVAESEGLRKLGITINKVGRDYFISSRRQASLYFLQPSLAVGC